MVANGSISDLRIDIENTDSQSRPPLLSISGPTERKMRLAPRLCHCYPAPIPLSRASLRLRHPVFLLHCPSKSTSSLPDEKKGTSASGTLSIVLLILCQGWCRSWTRGTNVKEKILSVAGPLYRNPKQGLSYSPGPISSYLL